MSKKASKQINLRLDNAQYRDALAVAKYLGVTLSGLIRIALKTYVSRYINKAHEEGFYGGEDE